MVDDGIQEVARAVVAGGRVPSSTTLAPGLATAVELCRAHEGPAAVLWGPDAELIFNGKFAELVRDAAHTLIGRSGSALAAFAAAGELGPRLVALARAVRHAGEAQPFDVDVPGRADGGRVRFVVAPLWGSSTAPEGVLALGRVEGAEATQLRAALLSEQEQLLALAAHDLKNPLNVIALAAYQLTTVNAPEVLRPRLERQADALRRSTKRINDLLGDLLDLARVERGGLIVEVEPCPVAELVEEAIGALPSLVQQKSLSVERSVETGLSVRCDRERTARVLGALLLNAAYASPEHAIIAVGATAQGEVAVFEVRDVGRGIPPDLLGLVFEQSYARSAEKRKLGRGLPLAKGIVEAQGGRIWIDPAPGGGTLVRFTVPLA